MIASHLLERFYLGLLLTASRASEASRLAHYYKRLTISSREITSSRLFWVRLPWSVLWRLVLREGADVEQRERGQVASTFSSLSSSSLRAEDKDLEVHLFLGICVCVCVSVGPVSKYNCLRNCSYI